MKALTRVLLPGSIPEDSEKIYHDKIDPWLLKCPLCRSRGSLLNGDQMETIVHIDKNRLCFTRESGKEEYCKFNNTKECFLCSVFSGKSEYKNLFRAE